MELLGHLEPPAGVEQHWPATPAITSPRSQRPGRRAPPDEVALKLSERPED
jgi:hypothetical protein